MSLAVEARSCCSKDMGFDQESREASETNWTASTPPRAGTGGSGETEDGRAGGHGKEGEQEEGLEMRMSEPSLCTAEEDEQEEDGKESKKLDLGPQISLKQQLEKDKDDESLKRWKEQLLGSVDLDSLGENLEPEVTILSLSILSPGRPDIVLAIPVVPSSKGSWFTLKEGCNYRLKFSFLVRNNIVSGLRYSNTVWKAGVKVDSTKEMVGTFSPQLEPYVCELPEETTPSGIFARGSYSARSRTDRATLYDEANSSSTSPRPFSFYALVAPLFFSLFLITICLFCFQFVDDDGKCHLEINYTFEIRKEWLSNC